MRVEFRIFARVVQSDFVQSCVVVRNVLLGFYFGGEKRRGKESQKIVNFCFGVSFIFVFFRDLGLSLYFEREFVGEEFVRIYFGLGLVVLGVFVGYFDDRFVVFQFICSCTFLVSRRQQQQQQFGFRDSFYFVVFVSSGFLRRFILFFLEVRIAETLFGLSEI